MRIKVIAIGTRMPAWVEQGTAEYLKRLPKELGLEIVELPLGFRSKNQPVQKAVQTEGNSMLQAIPANDQVIALDVNGSPLSTEKLARHIGQWQHSGNNFSLLIGGPDGLAGDCLARADMRWSLSALTLPHPLIRVILVEQFYRAWSINAGHPYHK